MTGISKQLIILFAISLPLIFPVREISINTKFGLISAIFFSPSSLESVIYVLVYPIFCKLLLMFKARVFSSSITRILEPIMLKLLICKGLFQVV